MLVTTSETLLRHVPPELQAVPSWTPWIALPRPGGKLRKVPAAPANGRLAPVDYRGEGRTFLDALHLMEEHAAPGVGFILRRGSGWLCLDFDGQNPDWIPQLTAFLGERAYAEQSPSGEGVHLWLPIAGGMNRRLPGVDIIADGFVTVTGRALNPVVHRMGAAPAEAPASPLPPSQETGQGFQDDDWVLRRMRAARNGARTTALLAGDWSAYPSRSEADLALARMLRFWCRDRDQVLRLMRGSGLQRAKWEAGGYLETTVDRALALGGPVWQGVRRDAQ